MAVHFFLLFPPAHRRTDHNFHNTRANKENHAQKLGCPSVGAVCIHHNIDQSNSKLYLQERSLILHFCNRDNSILPRLEIVSLFSTTNSLPHDAKTNFSHRLSQIGSAYVKVQYIYRDSTMISIDGTAGSSDSNFLNSITFQALRWDTIPVLVVSTTGQLKAGEQVASPVACIILMADFIFLNMF